MYVDRCTTFLSLKIRHAWSASTTTEEGVMPSLGTNKQGAALLLSRLCHSQPSLAQKSAEKEQNSLPFLAVLMIRSYLCQVCAICIGTSHVPAQKWLLCGETSMIFFLLRLSRRRNEGKRVYSMGAPLPPSHYSALAFQV